MSNFVIKIEAVNLLVRNDESKKIEVLGCFCTRYISHSNIDDAVLKAKALVISELYERRILCDDQQIFIESVNEISEIPTNVAGKGFTFYPIEEASNH